MKVGTPPDDELYELAFAIADIWKKLGHCLGVSEEVLHSIDQDFAMLSKKGYHMLIYWKRGATASYKVLNDALRHEDVQRQDLAEKFCQGGHKMVIIIIFFYIKCVLWLDGFEFAGLRIKQSGFDPGRDHYVTFLDYTIYSGCTSFHPCRC